VVVVWIEESQQLLELGGDEGGSLGRPASPKQLWGGEGRRERESNFLYFDIYIKGAF
jgi:hypothetical protein